MKNSYWTHHRSSKGNTLNKSEMLQTVLQLLKGGPKTLLEVATALGIDPKARPLDQTLQALKKTGHIEWDKGRRKWWVYKRLSASLHDPTPREWNAREKYMLYAQGYRDGSGTRPIRPDSSGLAAYDRGYSDGKKQRNEAVQKYADEIGYVPTILRAMG